MFQIWERGDASGFLGLYISDLVNSVHPVQQATSCTTGYIPYSRLHPVQQATSCTAGYILFSRLHPGQQARLVTSSRKKWLMWGRSIAAERCSSSSASANMSGPRQNMARYSPELARNFLKIEHRDINRTGGATLRQHQDSNRMAGTTSGQHKDNMRTSPGN